MTFIVTLNPNGREALKKNSKWVRHYLIPEENEALTDDNCNPKHISCITYDYVTYSD